MIQKAEKSDINPVLEITKACAKFMISKGIYQWNAHYPTKETFQNDLVRDELYVLKLNNIVIGCITISNLMDEEYKDVDWLTPNRANIYLHRLAVHPKYQGHGHAKRLMDFAEDFVKNKGFTSIRLDTFSQNQRNQKFYELRGYQKLDAIYFPKQSEHPFYCYELVL